MVVKLRATEGKPFSSDFQPHLREVKLVIMVSIALTRDTLPRNTSLPASFSVKTRFIKQQVYILHIKSIGSEFAAVLKANM